MEFLYILMYIYIYICIYIKHGVLPHELWGFILFSKNVLRGIGFFFISRPEETI